MFNHILRKSLQNLYTKLSPKLSDLDIAKANPNADKKIFKIGWLKLKQKIYTQRIRSGINKVKYVRNIKFSFHLRQQSRLTFREIKTTKILINKFNKFKIQIEWSNEDL